MIVKHRIAEKAANELLEAINEERIAYKKEMKEAKDSGAFQYMNILRGTMNGLSIAMDKVSERQRDHKKKPVKKPLPVKKETVEEIEKREQTKQDNYIDETIEEYDKAITDYLTEQLEDER